MHVDREEEQPQRQVVNGLLAIVGGAVAIGAVLSLVAVGAANLLLTGGEQAAPTDEPRIVLPSPTPTGGADSGRQGDEQTTRQATGSDGEQGESGDAAEPAITLEADPRSVSPMGRIDLSGEYPGGDGATLQVQRRQDGWVDFPVDVAVSGNTFSTYVQTGRTGKNRFRVVDENVGEVSNPVTVTVG